MFAYDLFAEPFIPLCPLQVDYDGEERPESAPVWMLMAGPRGVQINDVNAIYLIDHAWTYKTDMARKHLEQIPRLLYSELIKMEG